MPGKQQLMAMSAFGALAETRGRNTVDLLAVGTHQMQRIAHPRGMGSA